MSKYLIIGASLSGKTSLVKFLRESTNIKVSEIDEKLTDLNHGSFPSDSKYKKEVLFPKIFKWLLSEKDVIFFSNVWYFEPEDISRLRESGFTVIYLNVGIENLRRRNTLRIDKGYEDMEPYLNDMILYFNEIKDLIDNVIDANKSFASVSDDLIRLIHKKRE